MIYSFLVRFPQRECTAFLCPSWLGCPPGPGLQRYVPTVCNSCSQAGGRTGSVGLSVRVLPAAVSPSCPCDCPRVACACASSWRPPPVLPQPRCHHHWCQGPVPIFKCVAIRVGETSVGSKGGWGGGGPGRVPTHPLQGHRWALAHLPYPPRSASGVCPTPHHLISPPRMTFCRLAKLSTAVGTPLWRWTCPPARACSGLRSPLAPPLVGLHMPAATGGWRHFCHDWHGLASLLPLLA
jgi:hypothetical protein